MLAGAGHTRTAYSDAAASDAATAASDVGALDMGALDIDAVDRGALSIDELSIDELSIDELVERLLDADRVTASAHAAASRILAELNRRSAEVGSAHAAPDVRAFRPPNAAGGAGEDGASVAERDATRRDELGARLVVAEIAVARRQSESTVRAQLDESSRLARLPSALAALEAGMISPTHARALADGVYDLPVGSLPEYEALALPTAVRGTPAQTRRRVRALRERLHPFSIEIRAARRRRERRLDFEPDLDGMAWLHVLLPCADARGAFERVDAAARSLAAAPDEQRGIGQIRADITADLLLYGDVERSESLVSHTDERSVDERSIDERSIGERRAAGSRGPASTPQNEGGSTRRSETTREGRYARFRPTVRVTVPVLSLLGESDGPAILEGHGPIPLGMAQDLAAAAPSFTRILTHPETGTVLSVGRRSYAVPADLRRLVQLRDVRCRFPGCERGADRCDVDHTRSWEHGGRTSHDNLSCLCRAHHRLKHETSWRVARPPSSTRPSSGPRPPDDSRPPAHRHPPTDRAELVWTSPYGRTVSDSPDPPF